MQTRFNYGVVIIMKHTQQANTHTTGLCVGAATENNTQYDDATDSLFGLSGCKHLLGGAPAKLRIFPVEPNADHLQSASVCATTGLASEAVQPLDERPPSTLLINTKVKTRRTLSSQTQIPVADVHSQMFHPAPLMAAN